ncbi:hypothetical protein ACFU76_40115 [Streptomyces sp. NPDC057539]|uniref:hypothetical protein n=1 Tax=Streptomyces sp. NPDC057539 TaxID=3346159 RepID=UPI0036B2AA88
MKPPSGSSHEILVRGERENGEGVMIRVGASSGDFGTYNYGETITIDSLPAAK